jgi:enamine deaminase RidA (YjgF/YER057c/UK114 family)
MERSDLITAPAAPELGPTPGYSHVLVAQGRLVAVAGQIALDSDGNLVGAGDVEAQLHQVFRNLGHALRAAGADFGAVLRLGYFLTDIADLPVVRRVRDQYVDTSRPPPSTAVQVAALFAPEFLVEIDALAVVP